MRNLLTRMVARPVSAVACWLSRRYLARGRVTPGWLARWTNWHHCLCWRPMPRPEGAEVE